MAFCRKEQRGARALLNMLATFALGPTERSVPAQVAEGVVLIHADNAASLAAHSKLAGCREAGRFRSTDDRPWVVLVLDLEAARTDLRGAD